jgi:predicted Zn-dependent protease
MPKHGNQDLNGHYPFDDEGVPSRRVTLVENGILKEFLLSRSPLPGFPRSNGHGRRQAGREVVSRQGNLMVLSKKQVPYAELRRLLIAECRRQNKPYGLIFDDISGGFTTTSRGGPQAFKVLPLVVHRVYTNGRPDELVRGADLVGTPLASFSKIAATADDPAVFNGSCGAESGWVPVSAISPSILVTEIEIEKRAKGSARPPLLPAPTDAATPSAGGSAASRAPGAPASGAGPRASVPQDDVTLKAMADELGRSRAALKMDTFAPPYFVAYTAHELESVTVVAALGALVSTDHDRARRLWSDVRVGNANLDSSNFAGRGGGGAPDGLPLEENYDAIRRTLWLATDDAYKSAIETLSAKRAALQNQAEEPRPPDLGKAEAFTLAGEAPALDVDRTAWEKTARAVSAVFRRHPTIHEGRVTLQADRQVQRFVNSEGSWHRTGSVLLEVVLRASARGSDGTSYGDVRRFYARRAAELPSQDRLMAAAEELAGSLVALLTAPKVEEYTGPILFTGDAAATFYYRMIAEKLSDTAPPVTGNARSTQLARADKLVGQLGRRILPTGFRVVDDPTQTAADGVPLLGAYAVDDDGVPAQPLTLVEDGLLKAFFMSRIPTKEIAVSNGHGRRSGGGRITGQASNLIVTAANGAADLKARLRELCREEGLTFGLLVERFDLSGGGGTFRRAGGGRGRGFGGGGAPADRSDLPEVLMFRKVYVDGREELVRGGRLPGVTARTLRDVTAAGTDRSATTFRLSGLGPSAVTIVGPSLIVTRLDVRPAEAAADKPPLIPRPSLTARG